VSKMKMLRPISATIISIKNLLETEQIPFSCHMIAHECKSTKGLMRNLRVVWPVLNLKAACKKTPRIAMAAHNEVAKLAKLRGSLLGTASLEV
jgi:hypothetical protein